MHSGAFTEILFCFSLLSLMEEKKETNDNQQHSFFSVNFSDSSFENNPEPVGRLHFDSFNEFPPEHQNNLELLDCQDSLPPAKKLKSISNDPPDTKEDGFLESELATLIQGLGDISRDLYFKLSSQFSDCDLYENLCPKQLDEIIQDALAYEETLKQQKTRLVTRLEQLSKTLQPQ
ncbi:uncharacterized protein LOC134193096 [Corticium candelabrum]|uniref:uncharacterized protein LOC134193096 n=1 Tax=Corticium candelabrum TaxID=121492 RepID=UPI002E25ED56|nr:uncharacterized protein LOC134193096 [Corticium candelabrum]